jgi:hypothetical protein
VDGGWGGGSEGGWEGEREGGRKRGREGGKRLEVENQLIVFAYEDIYHEIFVWDYASESLIRGQGKSKKAREGGEEGGREGGSGHAR